MTIKVGDVVVVVKPTVCCGNASGIGITSAVETIDSRETFCPYCGSIESGRPVALLHPGWCEVSRLKRIPPLDELEGQRTQENLREPVRTV